MDVTELLPWALPVATSALLLGVLAQRRVARALAISQGHAVALVVTIGLIVAATLTPLRQAIEFGIAGSGQCDLSRIGLPSMEDMARSGADDIIPNVLLFAPFGLVVGLVPMSRRKLVLIAGSVATPILIEWTQLLVPALARGCESADVVDNLVGLGLGYGVAVVLHLVRILARGPRRQSPRDEGGLA